MLSRDDVDTALRYVNQATAQGVRRELWQIANDGQPNVLQRQVAYLWQRLGRWVRPLAIYQTCPRRLLRQSAVR